MNAPIIISEVGYLTRAKLLTCHPIRACGLHVCHASCRSTMVAACLDVAAWGVCLTVCVFPLTECLFLSFPPQETYSLPPTEYSKNKFTSISSVESWQRFNTRYWCKLCEIYFKLTANYLIICTKKMQVVKMPISLGAPNPLQQPTGSVIGHLVFFRPAGDAPSGCPSPRNCFRAWLFQARKLSNEACAMFFRRPRAPNLLRTRRDFCRKSSVVTATSRSPAGLAVSRCQEIQYIGSRRSTLIMSSAMEN